MRIRSFKVLPNIPERLKPLHDMAFNMWFSWNWEAVRLFSRLDPEIWDQSYQNPVHMLGLISQERLDAALKDDSFLASMDRVHEDFLGYIKPKTGTWFSQTHGETENRTVAYFSAEYGVDEGLPIYSGGLGILSGDHLKSASDLGIPLVAVGLLYRQGYFQQYLNRDGWQQEFYPENDWYNMPVHHEFDAEGKPIRIVVEMGDHNVTAQVWRVEVGRVPLYLLDTNIPENTPNDRVITAQLYGGDLDMRIRQEMLLGIGGIRALAALGIEPAVCHMNEGHSAFLALERIRHFMQEYKLSYEAAHELVWASNVFTTHTPVPAGNERFDADLACRYLTGHAESVGLTCDGFLALGRENPKNAHESFCMTVLALKTAAYRNGVSQLHGAVSRSMWKNIWPGVPESEIPISSVTNGTHIRSFLSHDMADLFDRYLGPRFAESPMAHEVWKRVNNIPDAELWRTHERRRERLVAFARRRLRGQLERHGAPAREMAFADEVLDPRALTIGFARRFATYKRSTLLLQDPDRLSRILTDPNRPVQLIFAGKAHPADHPGKELIRKLIHFSRDERFHRSIVFLEDYDINVARYLVQGVDVWLNTPRRPLEASGTSGMKAAVNGAINLSILDGWWDEGYSPEVGWAIGSGEEYSDTEAQDAIEGRALFDLLEKEVIPLFYHQGRNELPRGWIAKMKASMSTLGPVFNAHRMVSEYTERFYLPAGASYEKLKADGFASAKYLASWHEKVRTNWGALRIQNVTVDTEADLKVGAHHAISADLLLGVLQPEDVSVELYYGPLDSEGQLTEKATIVEMERTPSADERTFTFAGNIPCDQSGRFGFAVRVLPRFRDFLHRYEPNLILWE
ncbi:MAG: alpha-glucan family phosphorylase [Candidatus Latescibacterota bacterium]